VRLVCVFKVDYYTGDIKKVPDQQALNH